MANKEEELKRIDPQLTTKRLRTTCPQLVCIARKHCSLSLLCGSSKRFGFIDTFLMTVSSCHCPLCSHLIFARLLLTNSIHSFLLGTGKLGFSFVRITSLMLTNDRLWVGTGNGVILSVPLVAARPARDDGETSTSSPAKGGTGGPGGAVRVYSNEGKDGEATKGASFMPYCSMVSRGGLYVWLLSSL